VLRLVPLEILTATLIMKTEPISTSLHLISNLKEQILDSTGFSGKTGIILGSGLGALADALTDKKAVSYSELDGFPESTVEGHSGEFLTGTLNGSNVMLASGRFHLYEGYDFDTVAIPVKLFKALGIEI
jgi:purine-nucleoside phosphorylase